MNDDAPLPDLFQHELDAAGLDALFADYEACATLESVTAKGARTARAGEEVSLDRAAALLRQGAVRGVQVRYRHDELPWCDTILVVPSGFRVVRMSLPVA